MSPSQFGRDHHRDDRRPVRPPGPAGPPAHAAPLQRDREEQKLPPGTGHCHGRIQHDHDGGELPHSHKFGDPLWDASPGNWTGRRFDNWMDREEHRTEKQSSASASSAYWRRGTALICAGGVAMLWQNTNHSVCSSGLEQSASQCTVPVGIWTLGVIALLIGAVLLIVGAILRGKS